MKWTHSILEKIYLLNMTSRIDYGYAHFDFDWTWIRDKQIIHNGNQYMGMVMIIDSEGEIVGWYGYELISEKKNEKQE